MIPRLSSELVLIGLLDQLLRLPRQASHVRHAQFWRRNAVAISTRASAHKAFSRARMHGLEADVAFLPFVSSAARFDRDRDGLRVLGIRIKMFGATVSLYFLAELVVAALLPVFLLARRAAVARSAAAAFLARS